mgnify:CR=1 FL=1
MSTDPAASPVPEKKSQGPAKAPANAPDGAGEGQKTVENIEAVLDFHARESSKISTSQRLLERVSLVNGQPAFLAMTILFVTVWIGANVILPRFNQPAFDPFPYHLLHGIISLGALLTATVLLIRQERLSRLAEQRQHLDLKVTLLTEQKAAKLIELIEELRRDLPNVRNRLDTGATELKQPVNPELVRATLAEPLSADARNRVDADPPLPAPDRI